jgi:hypothetical protein
MDWQVNPSPHPTALPEENEMGRREENFSVNFSEEDGPGTRRGIIRREIRTKS